MDQKRGAEIVAKMIDFGKFPRLAVDLEVRGYVGEVLLTSARAEAVALVTPAGRLVHSFGSRALTQRADREGVTGRNALDALAAQATGGAF